MGTETELKFEVSPSDLRKLTTARTLRRRDGMPAKEEYLASIYFDTDKHELRTKGVSLRVRQSGDKRVQTIKTAATDVPFSRSEWNHKIDSDELDFRAARGTALAPMLTKRLKRQLMPIFETRILRRTVPFRKGGSRIEMALDEGQVRAGQKWAPITEVELELKGGNPADLFKLARVIGGLVPAKLALKSKSERGYDLTAAKTELAVQGQNIILQRGISTVDAFRIIGRSILRQLAANEPAVRESDPKGLHQMRVGLRRLRAAISVFSEFLGDKQTERIKGELKWLTGKLGPARDLDVMGTKIKQLRKAAPAKRALKEFSAELAVQRTNAFAKAKDAVNSTRYRCLLLDALQWIEAGDWAKQPSIASGHPRIEQFAKDVLTRRSKKAMKKANEFEQLDPHQRHKLRIAIKKLRYSTDFFYSLFSGRKMNAHLSGFKDRLKDLQDCLGVLNDIVVRQKLAPKIAVGSERTKRRARTLSAGAAFGREQTEIEPLLKAAAKAARKFAHAKRFWT
ncbi:CHAD domain-containing protein [Tardiphaga sp. vice304]|uniref:CYTH and CHAD domain-containing protein n=1 Tax=Tardiphaga sp. vice304 TaxID=2592817 RepID=UPI0011648338|nr:CYTH and CHAD domain-containing protein [Tardiphaga sp. vice304]QDM25673.1 CHAD domain-containing protein [Tardiphaga sp. vice304]